MIIWLLRKFFKTIIGELPPEKRIVYWNRFSVLLEEIAKASMEGAIKGALKEK